MADSTVSVGADLTPLDQDLRSLLDQVKVTLASVERMATSMEASVKASSDRVRKHTEQAAKSATSAWTGAAKTIGGGLAGLSAVAAGAGAALSVGLVGGIVAVTLAAGALRDEIIGLEGLKGFGVSPSSLAAIESATLAFKGLVAIGKSFVVQAGAEFAPAVEKISFSLVKLGLIALDAFAEFAKGKDVLREIAVFLVQQFLPAFTGPVDVLVGMIGTLGDLAGALGMDGLSAELEGVTARWRSFTREISEGIVDYAFGQASAALDEFGDATTDYDARARELLATVKTLGAEVTKTAAATVAWVNPLADSWKIVEAMTASSRELAAALAVVGAELAAAAIGAQLQADLVASTEASGELAESFERVGRALKLEAIKSSLAGAAEGMAKLAKGALGVLDALTGGAVSALSLDSLLSAVGSGDGAGAVNMAVDAGIAFVDAVVAGLPGMLSALVARIPDLIDTVVKAIPKIADALTASIPGLVAALAAGIPDLITVLIESLPAVAVALVVAIFTELVPRLPEIVWAIIEGLAKFFRDVIVEITSLGSKKTATFGDTPGPVRAPMGGLRASFAAGDFVVAARSPQGLRDQVNAKAPPAAAPVAPRLDLTDGHIAFDRMFRNNVRSGGTLSTLGGQRTGQAAVYR